MKSGALTTVVSGEKLAAHLGEDDWTIIDCRFELADTRVG